MLWIITADHIDTDQAGLVNAGSAKRRQAWDGAPAEARDAIRSTWAELCSHEFRLFDDDGNLYYEGVCHNLDEQGEDSAFEPLDWAEAYAGATRMDYRKKGEAQWQTL